jgi:hypothetical protein
MVRGGHSRGHDSVASSYKEPAHEKASFHYILLILVLISLTVSALAWINVNEIKSEVVPETVNVNDFLAKLTAHPEASAYVGVSPLNIIQVNNNNLANLQAQINGLDTSYVGSFIVQYTDSIVVYDYSNDAVRGSVALQQPQQAALPGDFFIKLNVHPQLAGLESEQPIGGQLDANSLSTLQQQFPEVYANAKVGDFLLRYTTLLIIYDYNADVIVNAVALG